jgi:hypothetical protein
MDMEEGSGMNSTFRVGSYVRDAQPDRMPGTGIVIGRHWSEYLNEKTGKIRSEWRYRVRWLDSGGGTTMCNEADLQPSVRNVPTFTSPEEADAWFEQNTAGWTDRVEDFNAAVGDVMLDQELRRMLGEAQ